MWFRLRRRRQPPPVLLPALDQLGELIERVVELLDGLVLQEHKPSSHAAEALEQAAPGELVFQEHKLPVDGWVAFAGAPGGYRLVEREGAPPSRGEVVDVDGTPFRVLRLGPSPLPGDARRCAFLERQEPGAAERKGDR